jgi:hypothetical protein
VVNSRQEAGNAVNHINVIAPYKHHGMWVFDDPRVGLAQEPFVAGADRIIDQMTAGISDAPRGFTMVFSAQPFPGYQHRFELKAPEGSGHVYLSRELGMEGWLCPALLRYFDSAPGELYVEVRK